MNTLLFNPHTQSLRNGWWIVIFVAFLAISRFIYPPVSHFLQDAGVDKTYLGPLAVSFLLIVTWIVLKLRKESFQHVGLKLDATWYRHLALGFLFCTAQIAMVVLAMYLAGGVTFAINPQGGMQSVLLGLYVFLFAALLEELLFRGFIFQRLIAGLGIWPPLVGMALIFAAGHATNPEVNKDTIILATLDIFLVAIVFGLAFIKTQSLALPVGMHLGWNWAQGNLFGFNVSGYQHHGLLTPTLTEQPAWITGAGFGPEATIFAVVSELVVIALLLRWKGVAKPSEKTLALQQESLVH